jgi:putative ABC transport system ATP-binding protein
VLTVQQNLDLAVTLARVPAEPGRVRETLARLDLAEKAGAYPHQLSMGQRQRVAIARAVINRPSVILADEPTAALDDARAEAVLALLALEARESGATLVVATHDRRIMDDFDTRLDLPAHAAVAADSAA